MEPAHEPKGTQGSKKRNKKAKGGKGDEDMHYVKKDESMVSKKYVKKLP